MTSEQPNGPRHGPHVIEPGFHISVILTEEEMNQSRVDPIQMAHAYMFDQTFRYLRDRFKGHRFGAQIKEYGQMNMPDGRVVLRSLGEAWLG